jgi:hypothetical protein
VARCRQHETENQPRCDLEIAECEQINWHSRPPGLTDVAAERQTLTAFESIHDCIDMNANASRVSAATRPKFCIGTRSAVANHHVGPAAFSASDPRAPGRAGRPRAPTHRLGPAGGPSRLALVVILRERMIRRAKPMGREHGSK